jgi:hypothetical protein
MFLPLILSELPCERHSVDSHLLHTLILLLFLFSLSSETVKIFFLSLNLKLLFSRDATISVLLFDVDFSIYILGDNIVFFIGMFMQVCIC